LLRVLPFLFSVCLTVCVRRGALSLHRRCMVSAGSSGRTSSDSSSGPAGAAGGAAGSLAGGVYRRKVRRRKELRRERRWLQECEARRAAHAPKVSTFAETAAFSGTVQQWVSAQDAAARKGRVIITTCVGCSVCGLWFAVCGLSCAVCRVPCCQSLGSVVHNLLVDPPSVLLSPVCAATCVRRRAVRSARRTRSARRATLTRRCR
jgi:hypothetical protein